jgi:hypothetical protein
MQAARILRGAVPAGALVLNAGAAHAQSCQSFYDVLTNGYERYSEPRASDPWERFWQQQAQADQMRDLQQEVDRLRRELEQQRNWDCVPNGRCR